MNVLIVEDDDYAREASSRYLSKLGYHVSAADTAAQAIQFAAEHAPDVTICDWRIGGPKDGAAVARELQDQYDTAIIFVTAYSLHDLRDVTRDLRVARYLRKPLSLGTLANTLQQLA